MDPHREIELKLSIEAEGAERVFEHPLLRTSGASPIEVQRLHSVYFDTRDRALAEAGIGLRLRRAGDRQWQTVKLGGREAAGLFVRTEVESEGAGERPDLRAVPDPAVRDRLIELVGEQPLEPVFETAFERQTRRVRDEFGEWSLCLDRGEIRAGFAREPICELELEHHRGPAAHLYDVALQLAEDVALRPAMHSKAERGERLRSGALPVVRPADPIDLPGDATLGRAIAAIAQDCLQQIGANAELVATGDDPEAIHQMRVGLRRMRALIALVRREVPSARLGRLRGALRGLATLLGDVRDLDVFIAERIDPLLARRRGDAALETLREDAVALREERRIALRSALRSGRHARLLLELGRWLASLEDRPERESAGDGEAESGDGADEPPPSPLARGAESFARAALTRLERRVKKRAETALSESPSARHELRIALKKLRYAGEFFRSFYGRKESKRYLRRLGRLLDLLGTQNDLETADRLVPILLERCPPERAVELARAVGLVEGYALGEQERSQGELAWRWQRFDDVRGFWAPE
jgi:inorganic triphosphatase YgiF